MAFDATICESLDPLLGALVYPDHLAIIDVVGIGADNLDEFEVLADPPCDLIDGVDNHQDPAQADMMHSE